MTTTKETQKNIKNMDETKQETIKNKPNKNYNIILNKTTI